MLSIYYIKSIFITFAHNEFKDDYFGTRLFGTIGGDSMSGITELAKLFKDRENIGVYSPMIGSIIELPVVRVRLGDKIILDASHLTICVMLQHNAEYSDIGREVVLLPYADGQNFIVIGVIQ